LGSAVRAPSLLSVIPWHLPNNWGKSTEKTSVRVAQYKSNVFVTVCVTVHHWCNNINSELEATITNFIDNYNQLKMFRAIISTILRSTRLCLHLVV
jgi:hypothetical protein